MREKILTCFTDMISEVLYIAPVLIFVIFIFPLQAEAADTAEPDGYVSSFDELQTWLDEHMSTGGTVALEQDITVPSDAQYSFANGRYAKEICILTRGHTIYVEGYLEFMPYLSIIGDGSDRELFHVCAGGELWMISITVDAGEEGVAVLQEEGSMLVYGTEEDMGLPEFSCTGRIIKAETIAAAALSWYYLEDIPVIRIPENESFSDRLLPAAVEAVVNRDDAQCHENLEVSWDTMSFPEDKERTFVTGGFGEGYSLYRGYAPRCLIVWESETEPFFLNCYAETSWDADLIYIYAETPLAGTVHLLGSADGTEWTEFNEENEYEPAAAEAGESLSWLLFIDKNTEGAETPRYYRMMLEKEDGTQELSEIVELNDDNLMTAADIEGGRGGEVSPVEGEEQLPDNRLPVQNGSSENSQVYQSKANRSAVQSGQNNMSALSLAPSSAEEGNPADTPDTGKKDAEEPSEEQMTTEEAEEKDTESLSLFTDPVMPELTETDSRNIIPAALAVLILCGLGAGIIVYRKKQKQA